jgi:hypothetical protein
LTLIPLAQAADSLADMARFCQAQVDRGEEPKLGEVRRAIEAIEAEIALFRRK